MKLAEYLKLKRKPKYHNRRVEYNGITFDSQKEANRYADLVILERQGVIELLQLQPSYVFDFNGTPLTYDSGRLVTYRADFLYKENGEWVVEDAKGFRTKVYKMKKALMRAVHGIEVLET